jgi:hypothetical protein
MSPFSPLRRPLAWLLAAALLACNDSPNELELEPISFGTIGGTSFVVTSGTVYQATTDGPIYADSTGGRITFDQDPAGLGMSDPDRLHLRTELALPNGGSLEIGAFAVSGTLFADALRVVLRRDAGQIEYEFHLGGSLFADSLFVPAPTIPSAVQWVVTEFYAQDVPGYGAGQSGITMWGLDDLTPTAGGDVLGCTAGPAIQGSTLSGDRVGYELRSAWIVSVDVVDEIVGPCV